MRVADAVEGWLKSVWSTLSEPGRSRAVEIRDLIATSSLADRELLSLSDVELRSVPGDDANRSHAAEVLRAAAKWAESQHRAAVSSGPDHRVAVSPAVCDNCGVLAVARCVACEAPTCGQHLAAGSRDTCARCAVRKLRAQEAVRQQSVPSIPTVAELDALANVPPTLEPPSGWPEITETEVPGVAEFAELARRVPWDRYRQCDALGAYGFGAILSVPSGRRSSISMASGVSRLEVITEGGRSWLQPFGHSSTGLLTVKLSDETRSSSASYDIAVAQSGHVFEGKRYGTSDLSGAMEAWHSTVSNAVELARRTSGTKDAEAKWIAAALAKDSHYREEMRVRGEGRNSQRQQKRLDKAERRLERAEKVLERKLRRRGLVRDY